MALIEGFVHLMGGITVRKQYADSLGFLDNPGKDPKVNTLKQPNISVIHLTSVSTLVEDRDEALREHMRFKKITLANPNVIHVRRKSDIPVNTEHMGVVFGMQHAPKKLRRCSDVRKFADMGIKFMALAYKGQTEYGSGFERNGPLTAEGRNLITLFADHGISLDISHASPQTAMDALEFICSEKLPVKPVASHSGIRTVYEHPRNISSDIIGMISALDGYVGIPLMTFFICPVTNLSNFRERFIRHVSNAVTGAGIDHVGIGSDCIHRDMTMAQAKEYFARMTQMLESEKPFGEYFPDRHEEIIMEGSHFFMVVEKWLKEAFHDGKKVTKICGGNFLAYLKRTLPYK